jgi:hypothetical protein
MSECDIYETNRALERLDGARLLKARVEYERLELFLQVASERFGCSEIIIEDVGYFLPMIELASSASLGGLVVRSIKIPEPLPALLPVAKPGFFVHCLVVPSGRGFLAFAAKRARCVDCDA